jgi:hypothetical protein
MSLNMIGIPGETYQARVTNTRYLANAQGFIANVANNDVEDLLGDGCLPVTLGLGSGSMIGKLIGANMNVTTDQAINLWLPTGTLWRPTKITVTNASISLTTAAGGVYPAASKGGTALVAAGQAYSGLTASSLSLDLTLATGTTVQTISPIYFSLTTGQGSAATADIYVYGDVYPAA